MQRAEGPVLRDIVLVGGGHSHVGVLRHFAMKPLPGVRLTLVCRDTHTPYSGMLPGYIAGHYEYDDVHIDLRRLAEFAGARFYRDEAVDLDLDARLVLCRNRPPVPYDLLSLNTGATPQTEDVPGAAEHTVAVKPIYRFNDRWQTLLGRVRRHEGRQRIAVVGGGASGVELTLAIQHRLHHELRAEGDPEAVEFHLVTRSREILPTHNVRVRRRFERILRLRGIRLHTNAAVKTIAAGVLETVTGERLEADEIIWATGAGGAPWLGGTGLQLDGDGFIQVTDTLQSVSDPDVFAAGDVATMINHPREKAGVFAVRQGSPLARNLRRRIRGARLAVYRPQRRWLALISTGGRYAVASRGTVSFSGTWVWRWKDRIDRTFMARFTDIPRMAGGDNAGRAKMPLTSDEAETLAASDMRCTGCGAKIAAPVLGRVLAGLSSASKRDDVMIGLATPDDAAVLRLPVGRDLVQSTDFFPAFISDPWMFGQIAANHALGDLYAMGAEPHSAMAVATVPYALPAKMEDTLHQMLSGALKVLDEAGCRLLGGHSGEGRELALGFTVNGLLPESQAALEKRGMREGDVLLLTKPLGTGTLLAAHARLAARGRWIDTAVEAMRGSAMAAARCLREQGATACTDVTGFGIAGHLLEMARASGASVELDLDALPRLPGARETLRAGIFSTLHPSNLDAASDFLETRDLHSHENYPLLFDPQTAGGLLASVPGSGADACLQALHSLGFRETAIVGRVTGGGTARTTVAATEDGRRTDA